MIRKFRGLTLVFLVVAALSSTARSQPAATAAVVGVVFVVNPAGPGAWPSPAVGFNVYIWSPQNGYVGPSITDSYGQFAFYDIPYGDYLLRIYHANQQVYQHPIRVPGRIDPIVVEDHL